MTIARVVPRQKSLAVSLLLLCISQGAPLQAQPVGSEGLRDDIEAEYQVAPIGGGIGLLPRVGDRGISLIELRVDGVYLDGDGPLSPQRLAVDLGPDAALILRLSYLDTATQRSVLGLAALTDAESAEIAPPAEPPPPIEPTPPAEPAFPAEPAPEAESDGREVRGDIFRIGQSVHVPAGELRRGDIIVIGGSLVVDGEVLGDIVVIGGTAQFGPEAFARRDVVIIGGRLTRDPGARFARSVDEIGLGMIDLDFADFGDFSLPWWSGQFFGSRWQDLGAWLMRFVFFGILGSIVLLISAGSAERVARRVTLEPVKAGFVGLLAQLLFLPLLVTGIVLLVITIIGIPLLILVPVVLVGALVVMVLGFTGVAQGVGQRFGGGAGGGSVFVVFWLGLLFVMIPTLVGEAVGLIPWLGIFAVMLGIVGFVVEYVAWTAGMGAVILNRFGGEPAVVAGPPSPIPESPYETPPTTDLPLTESLSGSSDDAV